MKETTQTIDSSNIEKESYYNLCKLCDITSYANPIHAFKATGESVTVIKDKCGNIIRKA